jgi:molybdopterin-guanine dinucleotide biosynthesis protein A
MSLTAIILSGGKSTRMGQDKGLMEINGKPMIQYVIDNITPVCSQIIISANQDTYKKFGYPVIKDDIADTGPAGGIVSSFPHSSNDKNLIISCDLPFVTPVFINILLNLSNKYEITIPELNGYIQPLCGIYLKDIYNRFKNIVEHGQSSMKNIIKEFNYRVVKEAEMNAIDLNHTLRNINSIKDFECFNN